MHSLGRKIWEWFVLSYSWLKKEFDLRVFVYLSEDSCSNRNVHNVFVRGQSTHAQLVNWMSKSTNWLAMENVAESCWSSINKLQWTSIYEVLSSQWLMTQSR